MKVFLYLLFAFSNAIIPVYDRSEKFFLPREDVNTLLKQYPTLELEIAIRCFSNPVLETVLDRNHYSLHFERDTDRYFLRLNAGKSSWVSGSSFLKGTVYLYLIGARVSADAADLISAPIQLVRVLPTPAVHANNSISFMTASESDEHGLLIRGEGLRGAKYVNFIFDVFFHKWQRDDGGELPYEIMSAFPLAEDEVVIRLRHGFKWRTDPGPVCIVGVGTGAGMVRQRGGCAGNGGVVVAVIQADPPDPMSHSAPDAVIGFETLVTISTDSAPAKVKRIYNTDTSLSITGTGFSSSPSIIKLYFSSGISSGSYVGSTFRISKASSSTQLTLLLLSDTFATWASESTTFPAYLILLAIDNGYGIQPVGCPEQKRGGEKKDFSGCVVAVIFSRPTVSPSVARGLSLLSSSLVIRGQGFTDGYYRPSGGGGDDRAWAGGGQIAATTLLQFTPPLSPQDYSVSVLNATALVIVLRLGASWPCHHSTGVMSVSGINTLGSSSSSGHWVTPSMDWGKVTVAIFNLLSASHVAISGKEKNGLFYGYMQESETAYDDDGKLQDPIAIKAMIHSKNIQQRQRQRTMKSILQQYEDMLGEFIVPVGASKAGGRIEEPGERHIERDSSLPAAAAIVGINIWDKEGTAGHRLHFGRDAIDMKQLERDIAADGAKHQQSRVKWLELNTTRVITRLRGGAQDRVS